MAPPIALLTSYFSPEIRALERLPASGPVLVVGNHSCLFYMPDVWVVGQALIARRGTEPPTYAMGYDLLFALPGVSSFLRRLGVIPAATDAAEAALREGAQVLVYPGGDWEACRPWTDRNRIDFAAHRGFVKLALRTGAPVVPVVTHGSHDAVVVLSRGEALARAMGLHHLRIKVFPLALGPPFGVTSVLAPPLPLPSAITVEFLPALDWSHFGPGAASDGAVVEACYNEITGLMQDALTRMHRENPHPVATGIVRLARRGLTSHPRGLPAAAGGAAAVRSG
ncbi:MAG TPA: 1-acyl-sn-glycerol-3-phosphate acyltransferase [Acidimicrobiales bacterium]|nr:1-acyl-sn-glycerol-3-phosphate acyltransferase [Acidimicrobiales bacterium]